MSCEAIAAELRQGTELLRAVDASHPARHSSVEFVFEQSWRLLTSAERQALARLSVFRGGFTVEAARAVAAAPLPVVAALVDKSLLRKDDSRLGLHPLVQQFAAVRLADRAELDATQAAHAAYFLRLLTQLRPAIAAGERAALQAVDADFENCRRAWLRAIAQPRSDEARRSAKALLDFCDVRGRFAESLALFSAAADSALAAADPVFRAQTRSQLAHVLYRLDRYDEARAMARTALREAGKGERETRRQALTVQATCALRRGRLAEARSLFQKVLDVTIPETHAATLAATLDHLALVEKGMGNFDEALRLGLQALAQHRNLGKPAAEALCLSNLGSLHLARHEDAAAMECLNAGLAICEREGFVQTSQYILSNLTEASLNLGDLAAAERYARRTLESALASDHRALVGAARFNLARIAAKRGDLGAARAGLGEGTGVVLPLGIPVLKFEALVCFAEILQAQGLADRARQVLHFAAEHPAATPGVRTQLRALLEDARERDGKRDDSSGWPTLGLDELLQRIVAEGAVAYASLLGAPRDSPQAA
jgi:tetratricopeptide (TPR) repeat protein